MDILIGVDQNASVFRSKKTLHPCGYARLWEKNAYLLHEVHAWLPEDKECVSYVHCKIEWDERNTNYLPQSSQILDYELHFGGFDV